VAPPSTPPDRPSLAQAFGLIAAAILLLTSTCFGVFGIGTVTSGGAAGEVLVLVALLIALVGLVGLVVGVSAIFRSLFGRKSPTLDLSSTAPAPVEPPQPPSRPTFGQGALLLIAGTVVFSSTCFAVVDTGRSAMTPFAMAFFLVGMLVSVWGFATMVMRLWSTWGTARTPATTMPPPAPQAPPAPTGDATGRGPGGQGSQP
jgi:tellurite resistance protein TehA-like permease